MSLVVWLPLTKDLRQQGLSNVTVTNNGATFNSVGKLGGCYSFDGVDDAITVGNLSTLVTDNFSFACWFYHDDTWSSKNYETIFGGPSGFELEAKSGSTNSPIIRAYSWGQGTFTYELNKWNHLVMTRTTTETKFYLNGELKLTGTAGSIPSGNYFIGSWSSTTGQNFKGKINDVRIYDHCLSPMEVKEIAKGLVLHYPLNRQGFGNENLITQAMINVDPWKSAISGNYTIDGKTGWILSNSILYSKSGNGANNIFSGLTYDTNTQYTISFKWRDDYRTDGKSSSLYIRFKYSDGTYSQVISSKDYNYWKEEVMTSTAGKTVTAITTTYGNGGNLLFTDLKLEKGAIKTPTSPIVNSDLYNSMGLNGTTEYDCSGFCNNGTRMGTFSWTSDTPKYSVSTYFPNTTTTTTFDDKCWITAPFILNNINQLTVSFWFKKEAITRGGLFTTNVATYTGTDLTVDDYDNSVKIRASDGTSVTLGSYDNLIPANTWCHWVVTFDGINVKVYVNSILKNTASYSATKMLKNITNITLGANKAGSVHRTAKGNYSDFRIYATALSADDVKSLYQNCATIDPDGTIRGQIRN